MRFLIVLLTFALFVGVLGFVATNVDTRVPLQVFRTWFEDLRLYVVVIGALLVGIVYTGLIAIAEGANIRLANRRLEREVRRLETEVHLLRTQPIASPRLEPDVPAPDRLARGPGEGRRGDDAESTAPGESPASAPVYDVEPDDDLYTGGRAV